MRDVAHGTVFSPVLQNPGTSRRHLITRREFRRPGIVDRFQMRRELHRLRVQAPNGASHDLHFRDGTTDYLCIEQVFKLRQYSTEHFPRHPELSDYVRRQAAMGRRPLIVDAGANIGASAAYFALTYPTAKIVAIEPEANNFALLLRNTKGLDVTCLHAGLSSSVGRLKVSNPDAAEWAYRTEATHEDSGIPSVAIGDIYRQECASGAAYPFIVKIDIEGAEADVFARDTGWFEQTPIVIIELHDWLLPKQGTAAGFLKCIAGQPRDFISLHENVFSIAHALE
jgi:FkbM family methyltransferase